LQIIHVESYDNRPYRWGVTSLKMESIEIRLVLYTPRLVRIQAFYTAVGMNWVAGLDPKIDESFRPDSPTDVTGLPFMIGTLGNSEFNFCFRASVDPSALSATEIVVRFSETGQVGRVVECLKAAGLFVPVGLDEQFDCNILDPDGRSIVLCDPSPFNG
jgi:hypothetical protein